MPRIAVAALALALALAIPLRLSADVWAYAAYGALVTHGIDPYARAYRADELAPLHDPVLDAALQAWGGSLPRDVYGPLFTAPCAVVVAATRPLGAEATVFVLRLLAAAALLGCIALAGRIRPRLATLLAYHPVVLWSAAEGHNDAWWLAAVLAAQRIRGERSRLAALTAAAAVKLTAVVPLAIALARLPRRSVTAALAVFGAIALAYAPVLWSVAAHGLDRGSGPPRISLLHAVSLAAWCGSPVPLAVAALLAALALAAVVRALRRGDTLAGAALLAWAAWPSPEPWYATWLVPVIALAGPSPAARGLLAATFTGLVLYTQDALGGTALRDPALLGGIMLALYALPLLIAALVPAPSPEPPPAPPTPPAPATASPTPAPSPAATTTPIPPSPSPSPTGSPSPAASPSGSPNPFGYVVAPTPPPNGTPRIVEVAISDRVLHSGALLVVRVTTSPDVITLVARTMGREIGIPQFAPGIFAGQQQIPTGIPFYFLNRTYQIDFVGTTADGRTAYTTLPLRLEH